MDVVVGRVGRAHGVRGEVVVDVRTDEPAERFAVGVRLGTDPVAVGPLTVAAVRPHQDRLLLQFDGVSDRSSAEGLRGVLLTAEVAVGDEPAGTDEFYDHQLVGLRVRDQRGSAVGEVADVVHNPGHDLLVVRRRDGGEALVPFVAELVTEVDLEGGALTVDDRPGLLDPEQMA